MTLCSVLTPPSPQGPGSRQTWSGLGDGTAALTIANLAQQLHPQLHLQQPQSDKDSRLIMVMTADTRTALQLQEELHFYLKDTDIPVLHLPDWETLPYDTFSPHQDIISERIHTLYQLPRLTGGVLVVPITTLLMRIAPPEYVSGQSLVLNTGENLPPNQLRKQLDNAGYRLVDTVYEHGEYAVRGALIDLYPMGADLPFRVDWFDDEIESLRTFDPETQLTIAQVKAINLLPAQEFPLTDSAIHQFLNRWHERFDVNHKACPVYQDISSGLATAGIEYYLPLFFDQCASLFDYLPENTHICTLGNIESSVENFWRDTTDRYENRCVDPTRPILPPKDILLSVSDLFSHCKQFSRSDLQTTALPAGHCEFNTAPLPEISVNEKFQEPLNALESFLIESNHRVLFCAESAGRREALLELLQRIRISPKEVESWQEFLSTNEKLAITVSPTDQGLHLPDNHITLITENMLFGGRVMQRRRRQKKESDSEQVIRNLTELKVGAPVVHEEHGVGRYQGLMTLDIDGQANEFLNLTYANEAKLYVPVASLHLISRYSGADDELAPLHKLGSDQWEKTRRKAAEKIRDVAAELLDIYARRAARKGFQYSDPDEAYRTFSVGFPFEETPDQETAIQAVKADMESEQPMDRLVCGDVGFGKTEVAMRAAFIAVHNGKQVAMLVPTTLLAQQHYQSFKDRFADWPVTVEVLSRFKSAKEQEAVLEKINNGKVDIVIGTHKLLSSDLNFKNLGLLMIDEEHRFGVRQKEKLKALRSEVDILTLTATPIPRTLNMAMANIRDLSIIATPPARRLAVKTFVRHRDNALIKEAVMREILRGGQVYFLHNEVKTIEKAEKELQELIPEARIGIGHGQMRERELEKVMSDFYHQRFNILLCTTIIETGIDVPNANTIIIERADKFGLAQLHQLRGRVGRSHHQAYAYLLTPGKRVMTSDAVKRLDAIASADDLGAGFTLATHDMEIRGAGELLGDEQSGQIHSIGFSLYMDMLDRAVKAIQKGETPNIEESLNAGLEINLRIPALIPEDYLPDVHTRLIMYKRLSNAKNADELQQLQIEMIDRFGLLPDASKNLIRVNKLKLTADTMGLQKVEASDSSIRLEFTQNTTVDPLKLVQLVQQQPNKYRLDGATTLRCQIATQEADKRLRAVEELLQHLKAE